jgi:hypothetical protein
MMSYCTGVSPLLQVWKPQPVCDLRVVVRISIVLYRTLIASKDIDARAVEPSAISVPRPVYLSHLAYMNGLIEGGTQARV